MRRALFLILVLPLIAGPVQAAPARTCFVTPDPVTLGSSFTVTATGLTPDAFYYINITQARDPSNNAHPNGTLETDGTGSGSTFFISTTWSADGILGVGSAKVRVYPRFAPARGTANCAFEVIP